MPTLVTGGSGFIGSNVVRALVRRGEAVRVLVRSSSNLANLRGLPIDVRTGDLRDRSSILRAVEGCDRVFHVAALYSFWERDPDRVYAVNVEGTQNVLDAARDLGVERVVHTSSVAALAVPHRGEIVTEETPADPSRIVGAYKRSKYLAEQAALDAARSGLPVVIVNPSFPVGPGDIGPTPTGRVLVDFLNGRMPAYVDTGMNVVSVEDVAEGHVLAAERGRVGERYILGGENVSMRRLLDLLAEITGLRAPRVRVPIRPILALAYANAALCRLTGGTPRMTPDTVRMSQHAMYYDAGKAVRELGMPQTPARVALRRAVEWFVAEGYVNRELRLPDRGE